MMPSTPKEWSKIASLLRMSYRDTLLYSEGERCFCSVPLSDNPEAPIENLCPLVPLLCRWKLSTYSLASFRAMGITFNILIY